MSQRRSRGQVDDRQSRFEGTDPLKPGDRVDWMFRMSDPPYPADYQPIPVILLEPIRVRPGGPTDALATGWKVATVDGGTIMFINDEEIRRGNSR